MQLKGFGTAFVANRKLLVALVFAFTLVVVCGIILAYTAYYNRSMSVVVLLPDDFHGDLPIRYVWENPRIVSGTVVLDGSTGVLRVPKNRGVFELWTRIVSARTSSGKEVPVASVVPFPDDLIAVRGPRNREGTLVLVVGTSADFEEGVKR